MKGQDVCVYGTVLDYRENWDNELSYLYFGTQEQFFLVSNYRWTEPVEGECITVAGTIKLNTYKVPYIKIDNKLQFCE